MNWKRAVSHPRAGLMLGLLVLFVAWIWGGLFALLGAGIGFVATGFDILATWWAIRLASHKPKSTFSTSILILAFLIKLPFFVILGSIAHQIGGNAPGGFLTGLAGVYLGLIGWSLAQA